VTEPILDKARAEARDDKARAEARDDKARAEAQDEKARVRAQTANAHYAPAEPRALAVMAALGALAILWVLAPVGIGVLLGTFLALALHSFYRKLVRRKHDPAYVALGMTVGATIAVTGTLGAFATVVVERGVSVLSRSPQWFTPGSAATLLVQRFADPLNALHLSPNDLEARVRGALGTIASSLAQWATQIVSAVLESILIVFFLSTTMYFVLRHWAALAQRAERLMPLNPRHTRHLMQALRRLGRSVLLGNFGTAVIQGIVSGIGYAIGGISEAALLGAITAMASLFPVIGTPLVWGPAALLLFMDGHPNRGIFELVWGTTMVVGFCDYFVRPKLVGRGETMSTWMTFVALFGGLKLFGIVGFLLGPLVIGLAIKVIALYERTRRFQLGLR